MSDSLVQIAEAPEEQSSGLPGCSYIYPPRVQAGEYAPLAANPYRGCGHACAYCYVPLVLKVKRPEFDAGAYPRPDFLKHLMRDAKKISEGRNYRASLLIVHDRCVQSI